MSGFPNPFAMFKTGPVAPAPAPTPNPNPNANSAPIPGVDPNNPTNPANAPAPQSAVNPPQTDPQDPFKAFSGMWDIDPTKLNPETPAFFANIDHAKVMESARKTNFAQMTQEQASAIQAGGPEALKAMQQILNAAAQNVYGQGAIATSRMVDQALAAQRKQFQDMLPGLITQQQARATIQETNPIFTNPALAPMVEGLRAQFQAKNPNATPAELATQVSDYFNAVGMQFAPKPAEPTSRGTEMVDWDKFMGY